MQNYHAIVLGCGYAGILAANTLSQHFERVTIIERHPDLFQSRQDTPRLGIPQANHLHVLLQQGQQLLNQFMPGILDEIQRLQCQQIDWSLDTRWYGPFGVYPQYSSKMKTLGFSRACLDHLMINRIRDIANIDIIIGDVTGLRCSENPEKIDTVDINLQDAGGFDSLHGDLIVDTRGRRSNITDILNQLGFNTITPTKVTNELSYASRFYQLKSNEHSHFKQFYLQVRPGKTKKGVVISPIENNRVVVTLIGLHDEKPPRDEDLFDAYLLGIPNADLQNYLTHLTPESDIHLCRNLHNLHYHLGKMKKWPQGLIVLGDAACVLNPVYGQGMTVISKQILLLEEQLKISKTNWEKQFQKNVDKILQLPWSMATGEDQRSIAAENLPFSLRFMHQYYDGILKLAVNNQRIHTQLTQVLHMMKKPSVFFNPVTLFKVLFMKLARSL